MNSICVYFSSFGTQPSRDRLHRIQREIIERWGPSALSRVAIEGLANDGESMIPVKELPILS